MPRIPEFDLAVLKTGDRAPLEALSVAAREVGFLTVCGSEIGQHQIRETFDAYRSFFKQDNAVKAEVDMARTGANRGWGGPRSEQVNPDANPDLKEVFDCGVELPAGHVLAAKGLAVYAPNLWPVGLTEFRQTVEAYLEVAMAEARALLRALSAALGYDPLAWDRAFSHPMALLRGNYYPSRPDWAGARDFGIAAHTDYGCLTFLATDGTPGLEIETRDGEWIPVMAPMGSFVVNFGEMLEMWTAGRVRATPHRVIGSAEERLSIPLFLNPSYDTNVAPPGDTNTVAAGPYLERRFSETYVHLQAGQPSA